MKVLCLGVVLACSTWFGAFLAVNACLGVEGAGVPPGSIRGEVCGVPLIGPWLYVTTVALVIFLVAAGRVVSMKALPFLTVLIVTCAAVLLVPAIIAVLPRG